MKSTMQTLQRLDKDIFPNKNSLEGSSPVIMNYSPSFDLDFVERLLGRRKKKQLPRLTRNRLYLQKERIENIIDSRLVWQMFSIAHVDTAGVTLTNGTFFKSRKMAKTFKDAKKIIAFIATIGGKIDSEVESLLQGGALAHGYVVDALGAGAVESLADRFHQQIAKELTGKKITAGLRFSPGYCDWPVSDQKMLFSLLDHGKVGVELSPSCLMSPTKSISAVFAIHEPGDRNSCINSHNPCLQCGKKDCIARRIDTVNTTH